MVPTTSQQQHPAAKMRHEPFSNHVKIPPFYPSLYKSMVAWTLFWDEFEAPSLVGQASWVDGLPCASSLQEPVPRKQKGPSLPSLHGHLYWIIGSYQHKMSPGNQEEVGYHPWEQSAEARLSSLWSSCCLVSQMLSLPSWLFLRVAFHTLCFQL